MRALIIALLSISALAQTPALSGGGTVARAGSPISLVCSGTCTGTVRWVASAGTLSGWATDTPTLLAAPVGEITVRRINVTAGTSASLTFSVLATNSAGVVAPDARPIFKQLIGNVQRLDQVPWPDYRSEIRATADVFGGLQGGVISPYWINDSPLAGTVTVDGAPGDTTLTGNGTNLAADFDCGSTAASGRRYLIVRYMDTTTGPAPFQRYFAVRMDDRDANDNPVPCTATTATISGTYWLPNGTYQYTRATNAQFATWAYTGGYANYYDNVLGFYRLYAATRETKYLTWARQLADWWITNPYWDLGQGGNFSQSERNQQLLGLMLRAEDGKPEYWPRLNWIIDLYVGSTRYGGTANLPDYDAREAGFALWWTAVAGKYHSDSAKRTAYTTVVNNMLNNRLAPWRQSDGTWRQWYTDDAYTNGPATVTNGSTAVTGTGFTSDSCAGQARIWFIDTTAESPANRIGDSQTYTCTYNSATSITLGSAYTGTGGSKRYKAGNEYYYPTTSGQGRLLGAGVQPFMQGILGQGLYHAYLLTNDSRIPTWLSDLSTWLRTTGRIAANKAVYSGRVFPNCEPTPAADNYICTGLDGDNSARTLWMEAAGALIVKHLISPDTTTATALDEAVGVNFGSNGGPSTSDGWITGDLAYWRSPSIGQGTAGGVVGSKFWGFVGGVGAMPIWTGQRLGGYTATTVTFSIVVGSGVAVDIRQGDAITAATCSAGTCTANYDAAQGAPQVRLTRGNVVGAWQ